MSLKRAILPLILLVAVGLLAVQNIRLRNTRHEPSHDPRGISSDTFARIAQEALPKTVTIYVRGENPQLRDISAGMLDQLVEQMEDHPNLEEILPRIQPEAFGQMDASGSGVVVRPDGHIVTNRHLFENMENPVFEVVLYDGRMFGGEDVELVAYDTLTDLAVLRIPMEGMSAVEFGDSERLNIGDLVIAIGNPLDLTNTVTQGIVSAKYRTTDQGVLVDFIQSSAHIEPGSSGGALLNIDGQLVGINTAIATETSRWQGFGFALPSNTVREVIDALIENGHVARGYIGITFPRESHGLPEAMRRLLGYRGPGGVLVRAIQPGGPADLAGLQTDDIVVSIADQPIASGTDLSRTVAALPIGSIVDVEIWRGNMATSEGHHLGVSLSIAERPEDVSGFIRPLRRLDESPQPMEAMAPAGLHLEIHRIGPAMRFTVADVEAGSAAADAGFQSGDIILRVNGVPAQSQTLLFSALRLTDGPLVNHAFLVERDQERLYLTLSAEAAGLPPAPEIEPTEAMAPAATAPEPS